MQPRESSMKQHLPLALVAAALATAAVLGPGAFGQAAPTPFASAPEANQKTVRALFKLADANQDGQLTRAEAQGHLPFTFRDFESIDSARRGWISFEQFVDYTRKRVGRQADDIIRTGETF